MSAIKIYINIALLIFLFSVCSCTTNYIDTVGNHSQIPVNSDFFQFYPDSNVFRYKSNIVLTKDTEKVYPKFFEVTLPKKIRYYTLIGSTDFSFYYDKNQVVFIKIDIEGTKSNTDTVYTPSREQLDEFIESEVRAGSGKYNLKNTSFNPSRKHLVMQKGDAAILLYNIEGKNLDLFSNYVGQFRFIN